MSRAGWLPASAYGATLGAVAGRTLVVGSAEVEFAVIDISGIPIPSWEMVTGMVALGMGVTFVGAAAIGYRKSLDTESWRPIQGTVSTVEVSCERGDDASSWKPKVTYVYEVDGQRYGGTRLRVLERTYAFKSSARDVADQFRAGQPVTVLVNPDDPEDAVLFGGPQPGSASIFALVGLVFLGVGLYVLFTA